MILHLRTETPNFTKEIASWGTLWGQIQSHVICLWKWRNRKQNKVVLIGQTQKTMENRHHEKLGRESNQIKSGRKWKQGLAPQKAHGFFLISSFPTFTNSLMEHIAFWFLFFPHYFWHNSDLLNTSCICKVKPSLMNHSLYPFTLLWQGWKNQLTCLKFLNGTNWTMSRSTGSPLGDLRMPSSPSNICMSLKSALPTPTMMTDMGRWEACTMASLVSAMSVMTPSVRISRMKYCWSCWARSEKLYHWFIFQNCLTF